MGIEVIESINIHNDKDIYNVARANGQYNRNLDGGDDMNQQLQQKNTSTYYHRHYY
jgi:hypothetical protein